VNPSEIEDGGIINDIVLEGGNNPRKKIGNQQLHNTTATRTLDGRWHIVGYAAFPNYLNNNQPMVLRFDTFATDDDEVSNLVFSLSGGLIPEAFLIRKLSVIDHD
jgi:hypothetical protein